MIGKRLRLVVIQGCEAMQSADGWYAGLAVDVAMGWRLGWAGKREGIKANAIRCACDSVPPLATKDGKQDGLG